MATSKRDELFGTYGERKPNIVRKKMVVGEEQQVGMSEAEVAKALDAAARAEPAPEEPTEEPEAQPVDAGPEGGQPAEPEPAPTAAEPEPQAAVEPTEPEPAEPAAPEPQPEAAAPEPPESDSVTISRAEFERLKSEGLMQADYTRKTQATAELRKKLDEATTAASTERDEYHRLIGEVTDLLKAGAQEPNWAEARRTMTPDQYADMRDAWAARQSDITIANAERDRVAKRKAEADAKRRQEFVEAERERLFALKPELREPAKLRSWLSRMKQTVTELGFTGEEFDAVSDHRLFVLIDRAASGKGPMPNRPQTTKPPVRSPRSVGPGAAQPPKPAPNAKEQARERLRREHSVEAGGAYIETLLED
jgi:hypothetical protein